MGSCEPVKGVSAGDGAVSIGPGSYFTLTHGIVPSGGRSRVDEYSLVFDFKVPDIGNFACFFQTDGDNKSDGDCFVRDSSGAIGVSATGYSAATIKPETWYRLIVAVNNGNRYDIYLNGRKILAGAPQSMDGRFSLGPNLLICADDNGEDGRMDLSYLAVYDKAISDAEAAGLKGPSGRDPSKFLTAPYLQNVRTNGISVMWETAGIENCVVEYGTNRSYGRKAACASSLTAGKTRIWKSVLAGLPAGRNCHYRTIVSGTTNEDAVFSTAPAAFRNFTFGVWSDSQGGSYNPTTAMMRRMSTNVNLAVCCGDVAENGGSYESVSSSFLARVPAFLGPASVPFFVAWGNHCDVGSSIVRDFTDQPGPANFSFDYAGCHFVCLDDRERYDFGWIEKNLADAAKTARHIFLFVHRPPFCELWVDGDDLLRKKLVPLLEKYRVDAVFSGHTHEYERGSLNGVHYCVTGGGSWLDSPEKVVAHWPHMTVGGDHDLGPGIDHGLVNEYVTIEVTPQGWTARMTAFNPDGSPMTGVSDTFSGGNKKND